jgi:hypothetical protein
MATAWGSLGRAEVVNELARLQEPWEVIEHPDCFQVVDAAGRFILSVSHRQDLHRGRYTHAGNFLNAREAETIANAVADMRTTLR